MIGIGSQDSSQEQRQLVGGVVRWTHDSDRPDEDKDPCARGSGGSYIQNGERKNAKVETQQRTCHCRQALVLC